MSLNKDSFSSIKKIPYGKQSIFSEDIEEVKKVLESDYLTTGPQVKNFEEKFADYVGAKYAVAVSSGTAGLHLACLAAGLKEKEEIISSPMTFSASTNCALYCGARPIFVDINEQGLIDAEKIEEKINLKTKIILPVHYSGLSCNMERIKEISDKHNLIIIEDACHALGARYKNSKIGDCKYSNMAVFSLHPVKHITSGEGGVITTNSIFFYKRLLSLRNHGIIKKPEENEENENVAPWRQEMWYLGYNYRITDFQCALAKSQLNKINEFIDKRRKISQRYDKELQGLNIERINENKDQFNSYHLYVIKVKDERTRLKLFNHLIKKKIFCQVHYLPVYLNQYYQKLGYDKGICPKSEEFYKRIISLPIYPSLTEEEQGKVIFEIKKTLSNKNIILKEAVRSDCDDLFKWKNDQQTRKSSFNMEEVSYENHSKWFEDSLKDQNRKIFIAFNEDNEKIGQIRFDQEGENTEIDITVAPEFRGKNFGLALLQKASEDYLTNNPKNKLIGKIKKENKASIKIFQKSNFKMVKEEKNYLEFHRTSNKKMAIILTEAGVVKKNGLTKKIGLGHLSRCISLYQAFIKENIQPLIVINSDESIMEHLSDKEFLILNWIEEKEKLFNLIDKKDIVIIDSYLADKELYQQISEKAVLSAYIDDYNRIDYPKGIIINPSIFKKDNFYPVSENKSYILGNKYALLKEEFTNNLVKNINDNIKEVLITFGSDDDKEMTTKIITMILREKQSLKIKVIIGKSFTEENKKKIRSIKNERVELFYSPNAQEMKNLMANSDLTISASGQTLYELSSMGIPTIAVTTEKDQLTNVKHFDESGCLLYAGNYSEENIIEKIKEKMIIAESKEVRKKLSRVGREFVDGKGPERVVKKILGKKIGIIIQARMGSTRLSGKIMMDLQGKPVLQHVIERCRKSKADEVIIATSVNPENYVIEEFCKSINIPCYRGSENDLLSRYYETAKKYNLDIVIRITSDCPLIDYEIINKHIDKFMEGYDYVSNVAEVRTYPVGLDVGVFSFKVIEEMHNTVDNPDNFKYREIDREHVDEYLLRHLNDYKTYTIKNEVNYSQLRWTLDEKNDYDFIKKVYDNLYPSNNDFIMKDILRLLEEKPELKEINSSVQQKDPYQDV